MEVVEVPDAAVDRVPDRDEDGQGPGEEGEDLVGGDGGGRVRLAPTKGVDYRINALANFSVQANQAHHVSGICHTLVEVGHGGRLFVKLKATGGRGARLRVS